jgi:hypothetical protein
VFQQPSQGDRFTVSEHTGALCLFFVHDIRQSIPTSFGDKEAVACNIHVLEGTDAGEIFQDCLIFQGGLIGSLRRAAGGDPVLGRIAQGIAKPGQNAPYILSEFTDADAAKAEAYLTERAKRFQGTGNGQPAPAKPEPPPAAPVTAQVDIASLPPEVQELLKQSGAMPR